MTVVHKYAPSRYDLIEDLLTWLERREGPRVPARPGARGGDQLQREKAEVASLTAPALITHLARRSVKRIPTVEELETLLDLRDARPKGGDIWYPSCDHPRITGGSIQVDDARRVLRFAIWDQTGELDVPVTLLTSLFGRYGRAQFRIAHGRDEDTDFHFCFFAGGKLRYFRASSPRHYKSPLDKPEVAGNPESATVESALAAAGLQADEALLEFDRDLRGYRAIREEQAFCTSFTFSFELSGSYGPYRFWWLKKRPLHRP